MSLQPPPPPVDGDSSPQDSAPTSPSEAEDRTPLALAEPHPTSRSAAPLDDYDPHADGLPGASEAEPTLRISAADRVQRRDSEAAARRTPSRRSLVRLVVLGLVGGAVAAGVVLIRGAVDPGTDLFAYLDASSSDFRPSLVTVDATAAERYVLDAFGWPVEAPELPDLQLVGVGEAGILATPALDVSMPAFRYDSRDGETLVVFVYDYVLLDGAEGALDLPEAVYARLAESPSVDVRRQGGLSFVSWRVRSVVYTAVTDDEAIAERIALDVSG